MHDHAAEGNEFFKCDFCRQPWADDRPMVEGHQGSLICSACLSVAYLHVHGPQTAGLGAESPAIACRMCLETRSGPRWASPLDPEAVACKRCIRQSAGVLERDPEYAWRRPDGLNGGDSSAEQAEDGED
ncbi:MAG: hypothetical protein JNK35_01265 [Phycisphaerae bacterium]|nr:hypothetical protein [Phycisphaerae bacterium]